MTAHEHATAKPLTKQAAKKLAYFHAALALAKAINGSEP